MKAEPMDDTPWTIKWVRGASFLQVGLMDVEKAAGLMPYRRSRSYSMLLRLRGALTEATLNVQHLNRTLDETKMTAEDPKNWLTWFI